MQQASHRCPLILCHSGALRWPLIL